MSHPQTLWSDAWILLAIIYASRSRKAAPLSNIIASGDYINHAILTRGELETGLARLINAGYVVQNELGFVPTKTVASFWASSASKESRVTEALNSVCSFIGASEWKPEPLPETTSELYVPDAAYRKAVETYLQRMKSV